MSIELWDIAIPNYWWNRGVWVSGCLSIVSTSAGNQATSGCQGNWIIWLGSGIAKISGSAGIRSNQAANPAPSTAIRSISWAGNILARWVPNRSVQEIRKYRMPRAQAISDSSISSKYKRRSFQLSTIGDLLNLIWSSRTEIPHGAIRGFLPQLVYFVNSFTAVRMKAASSGFWWGLPAWCPQIEGIGRY